MMAKWFTWLLLLNIYDLEMANQVRGRLRWVVSIALMTHSRRDVTRGKVLLGTAHVTVNEATCNGCIYTYFWWNTCKKLKTSLISGFASSASRSYFRGLERFYLTATWTWHLPPLAQQKKFSLSLSFLLCREIFSSPLFLMFIYASHLARF